MTEFAGRLLRRACALIAVAGSVAACGATAPATRPSSQAGAARRVTRTVLVLTQTRGYHHASIPWAIAALHRLAAHDGRYRVVFLGSATALTSARLRQASAVVFLLTSGELPLSPAGKRALLAYVHRGGGVVGFHSATDTFHHWPGYIAMIGAEFSHHPLPSTQRVVVEDRGAPMTRSLPARFALHEEFYVFRRDPRQRAHVLVRLDTPHDHPDLPLVWCRRSDRGRVFYDALGHFPQTWSDRRQLALAAGGIAWAAGLVSAPSC